MGVKCAQMGKKCAQNVLEMCSKCAQNARKIGSKWAQNGLKMGSKCSRLHLIFWSVLAHCGQSQTQTEKWLNIDCSASRSISLGPCPCPCMHCTVFSWSFHIWQASRFLQDTVDLFCSQFLTRNRKPQEKRLLFFFFCSLCAHRTESLN